MPDELKRLSHRKHELWHINKRSKWLNKNRVADFETTSKKLQDLTIKTVSEYEKITYRSKQNPKLINSYIRKKQQVRKHVKALKNAFGITIIEGQAITNELNNHYNSVFVNEVNEEQLSTFDNRTTI